ncbi:MAG: DOPA 4,5-dioxygenase family protein [Woeseiaceae bacterium]
MNKTKFPVNIHDNYHAHVYFEQETIEFAKDLCKKAGDLFTLVVGRVHEKTIGPHPKWSCQISFSSNDFEQIIPWLEANRQGLSVLVHALTDDSLHDHTEYAYWLGNKINLNLDIFRL